MLDLAVAQVKRVATTTEDAEMKKQVEGYLSSVEDLIEIAGQKAIHL